MSELEYFTLSHRWGDRPMFKLTRATAEELYAGIPASRLPQTFRDAVHVTKSHGRRYLWIDYLCIYQDDDDRTDWLRESSAMDLVYMHGVCNISAIGAADGSIGLYQDRNPELMSVEAEFRPLDQEDPSPEKCVVALDEVWKAEVHLAGLNRRGWVLQERVLSKRVLHFGRDQLLWECCELNATEVFPLGVIPTMNPEMAEIGYKAETALYGNAGAAPEDANGRHLALFQLWDYMIETYSGCTLSVSGDNLIALSGIARRMASLLSDDFVMGFWRSHFADGLFWRLDRFSRDRNPPPCPETWRAPTWSWASVDSAISSGGIPGYRGLVMSIQLLDILRVPSSDHTFAGQEHSMTTSDLILRGQLIRMRLLVAWEDPNTSRLDDVSVSTHPRFAWDAVDDTLQDDYEQGRLFVMPGRKCYFAETDFSYYVQSLLLRCEDSASGKFSRVGFHVSYGDDLCESLLSYHDLDEDIPCLEWDANRRLHTICVI